ncbi:MAG TPA: hypothetical protein VF763_01005 [Candidatus Limnocylindrales bacterium]
MGLAWALPSLATITAFAVVGLVALLPTRRLFLAGLGPRTLLAYLVLLIGLSLLGLEARAGARFLLPLLVGLYLAPFVIPAGLLARLAGPRPRRPPPKDVTPRPPGLGPGREG